MYKTLMLLALLAALPSQASAQRPDPMDAQAPVPPLRYQSSLLPELRFAAADPKPGAWREANDKVLQSGGWRAYARQAQGAASATPNTPTPAAAPAAAPAASASYSGRPAP